MAETIRCPRCGGDLEAGHVLDRAGHDSPTTQAQWQPGEPARSFWTGGVKVRRGELLPVTTYRCAACGYLEMYARPEADGR